MTNRSARSPVKYPAWAPKSLCDQHADLLSTLPLAKPAQHIHDLLTRLLGVDIGVDTRSLGNAWRLVQARAKGTRAGPALPVMILNTILKNMHGAPTYRQKPPSEILEIEAEVATAIKTLLRNLPKTRFAADYKPLCGALRAIQEDIDAYAKEVSGHPRMNPNVTHAKRNHLIAALSHLVKLELGSYHDSAVAVFASAALQQDISAKYVADRHRPSKKHTTK